MNAHHEIRRLARRPSVPVALVLTLVVALATSLVSFARHASHAPDPVDSAAIGDVDGTDPRAQVAQALEPDQEPPDIETLGTDPRDEPFPELELSASAQSIVLLVELSSPTDVQLVDSAVSLAPPPARVGGLPLILVEALDSTGAIIESYNDWHPLWVAEHGHGDGDDHDHSLVVEETGVARLIVRFDPAIETVRLTDIVDEEQPIELIEIDVRPIIATYCAEHADDPACALDEGCGPGYWWQHAAPWIPTGYSRSQSVGSVFSNASESLATASLHEALGFRGGRGPTGAEMTLLRQAVAALLNAAHPTVNYALSEVDLLALVDAAIADGRAAMLDLATELDGLNALVCPIDAGGQPASG